MLVTREAFAGGFVERLRALSDRGPKILPEEEIDRSLAAFLAALPSDRPLWLFGYGSLIWNPTIHYAERRRAWLWGRRRAFCLWTTLGRGSPDRPGLVLGLAPGGSCSGVAFRLDRATLEEELRLIWRREMITDAYRPALTRLRLCGAPMEDAPAPGRGAADEALGLAFVMDPASERFAGGLAEAQQADVIARASGVIGPCCDYLFETERGLREVGLRDRALERLARRVRRIQAGAP